MTLSILICTRNRGADLQESLKSFACLQLPSNSNIEVVVVDNGSTDATAEIVRAVHLPRIEIKYVLEPRTGKSIALNTGLSVSRGDVLIFTDDDVRASPHWLVKISEPILDRKYDATVGTVQIAPHLLRPWMQHMHLAWLASTHYLDPVHPETAVGANMAISRDVLNRVPRFDPELGPGQLGLWEDTLFSMQLKAAGYRLGMAPDAIVEHHFDSARLTRQSFEKHAERVGKSDAYVSWHWKHEQHAIPSFTAARYRIELRLKRFFRWKDWKFDEGMPLWELYLLSGISYYKQLALEQNRKRAYERFGLVKKGDT